MRSSLTMLKLLFLCVAFASASAASTITYGQSARIDTESDLEQRLKAELISLKDKTDNFPQVCRNIADAIKKGLDSSNDFTSLINNVRTNVRKTIRTEVAGDSFRDWTESYNRLVDELESEEALSQFPGQPGFEQRKNAYLIGIKVLQEVADELDPRSSSAAIPSNAQDEDRIAERIANTLRDDARLQLFKFDTQFQKTVNKLIAELEDLVQSVDPNRITASEYKKRTSDAVLNVIRSLEQAQAIKDRWELAYNIFAEEVDKSTKLQKNSSEDWEKALAILISGLKRASGEESRFVDELKSNQKNRARVAGANSGYGQGGTSGYGGFGNTWHSVHAARKIERIRAYGAINRAKIQRIQGW